MSIEIIDYDHDRDFDAVKQIWLDVGWFNEDNVEDNEKGLEVMLQHAKTVVCPIDGVAECSVMSLPGFMRYLNQELQLGVIAAVTTGHVARRMGAARKLTADSLATLAEDGAEIAALGMFDQGFYNQVGFGSSSYMSMFHFDPNSLTVTNRFRPPKRLARDNWRDMHTAMKNRKRSHGGCWITPPETMQSEAIWTPSAFGLGYYDGPDNTLSHFFWGEKEGQHGPYQITYLAYQSTDQLFELLALIKSLGDQIHKVQLEAPPEIQLQDLLDQPFRIQRMTEGSEHENYHEAAAHMQARILDLPACMAKTELPGETLSFNLALTDPVTDHLLKPRRWQGVAGDYVVTLGPQSAAVVGKQAGLPVLQASVGAFTRMWLGVRNASSLTLTDDLQGSTELLQDLDRVVRVPSPHFGWDF